MSTRRVPQARFTAEHVAQVKAMAEDAMWGWWRRLAFRLAITPEIVFGLCEDLEPWLAQESPAPNTAPER